MLIEIRDKENNPVAQFTGTKEGAESAYPNHYCSLERVGLAIYSPRIQDFTALIQEPQPGGWFASMTLDDLESGEEIGELTSSSSTQTGAMGKLARFCLTLGYRDELMFKDDYDNLVATADLTRSKVFMKIHGKKKTW